MRRGREGKAREREHDEADAGSRGATKHLCPHAVDVPKRHPANKRCMVHVGCKSGSSGRTATATTSSGTSATTSDTERRKGRGGSGEERTRLQRKQRRTARGACTPRGALGCPKPSSQPRTRAPKGVHSMQGCQQLLPKGGAWRAGGACEGPAPTTTLGARQGLRCHTCNSTCASTTSTSSASTSTTHRSASSCRTCTRCRGWGHRRHTEAGSHHALPCLASTDALGLLQHLHALQYSTPSRTASHTKTHTPPKRTLQHGTTDAA